MSRNEIPELHGENSKFHYLFNDPLPQAVAQSMLRESRARRKIWGEQNRLQNWDVTTVTSTPTLARALCQKSHADFTGHVGRPSEPNLERIAELYRIPRYSECWGEFTAGSCKEFIGEYIELHRGFHFAASESASTIGHAALTQNPPRPDLPRLTAKPILARITSIDEGNQTIYIELTMRRQGADAQGQPFDGELVCQTFRHQGVPLNVRSGTLRINASRREIVPGMDRRRASADGGEERHERKANTITLRPSGRDFMQWVIEADKAPIGIVSQELVDLFKLSGHRPGDIIEAEFFAEDPGLVAAIDERSSGDTLQVAIAEEEDANPAIVLASGKMSHESKQRVLAHIAKLSLGAFGDGRGNGSATLARYALEIVEESDDSAEPK